MNFITYGFHIGYAAAQIKGGINIILINFRQKNTAEQNKYIYLAE